PHAASPSREGFLAGCVAAAAGASKPRSGTAPPTWRRTERQDARMGREAGFPERAGARPGRHGDPAPDPTGRTERAGTGREGRAGQVQSPGERAPGRTERTQATEAPPRRDPARQAPAGIEAARVQADDVRPDRGQGARPDRGDPAAPGRGEEAREGSRGERGRQEGAGWVEGGRGPGGERPSAGPG